MATLHMHGSFNDRRERRLLQRSFSYFTKELGIDKNDFTLFLRKSHLNPPPALAVYKAGKTGGMVTQISPKEFYMELASDITLSYLVAVFAHETVHIKQMVKRELKLDKPGKPIIWHGKPYADFTDRKSYMNLPWEKEAFGRMYKLRDGAITAYDVDDLSYIMMRVIAEEALRPPVEAFKLAA